MHVIYCFGLTFNSNTWCSDSLPTNMKYYYSLQFNTCVIRMGDCKVELRLLRLTIVPYALCSLDEEAINNNKILIIQQTISFSFQVAIIGGWRVRGLIWFSQFTSWSQWFETTNFPLLNEFHLGFPINKPARSCLQSSEQKKN